MINFLVFGRLWACSALCAVMLSQGACDGVVRVRGALATVTGSAVASDCSASLFLVEGDKRLGLRPFEPGEFLISFTVLPAKRTYYVEVECPGYQTFRSSVFTRDGTFGEPEDLGEIRLVENR